MTSVVKRSVILRGIDTRDQEVREDLWCDVDPASSVTTTHWWRELAAAASVTTARRRYVDAVLSDSRRRDREQRFVELEGRLAEAIAPAQDDTLRLIELCCHPALPRPGQIALTLRAVGGLNTPQIAHAYALPEATIAQRIVRAKRRLREVDAAVAQAMVAGPEAGLAALAALLPQPPRAQSVAAHLSERIGDAHSAAKAYRQAIKYTTSAAERNYLDRRLAALSGGTNA